ncbi:uncharacterized protein N7473_009614 [Penicillium subrubescens]|uniref:C3H1-type domain-containing protein n=1 Tax=Penicillium subrubescens TaxID=1316194 RepID=A0A1Q5UFQ1_9EURO|nr:uncharacterized protein N7473_009614 [Penicillium subrubescens]KAJ5886940.1 hypothetical protein N7473_009614 [Penicillium subrubescens]OKP11310.1 hypothetical protein PENSUB_3147 [Penicillium subrubescens]
MEQSSAQNQMPGLPHAGAPQGVPSADYWSSIDALYQDPQLQPQAAPSQQQNPSAQQQAPMGITWDHPVFQQQQQRAQQHQNPLAPQSDPNHGIYSSIPPPSWQSNPLQTPARYANSPQYQTQQQTSQYQQGQMPFDPLSINPSESSNFPSYSYQPGYFHPQQLPLQDSFPSRTPPQQHQPQHQQQQQARQQQPEYSTSAPQSSMQYSMPSSFPQDLLSNTIDLTNDDFPSTESGVSHQTIDPSFLNEMARSSNASHPLPSNFSFGGSVDFERPDGLFNYFQNDLSVQPQLTTPQNTGVAQLGGLAPRPAGIPHQPALAPAPKKAPAKKAPQVKKTGIKGQKKQQTESDSGSSDESDLEVDPEPSPLPAVRSSEPLEAAHYDTIQAVWSPRNLRVPAEKVKASLVAFKDVVKGLRDGWKDQVQAMKTAENHGDNDKATKLKQAVALQRRTMEKIISATLETGHPVIVEKLGEHPVTLSVFYSFLADRFQAADLEGSLTSNLLKLLARFVTVDEELLQKTNMAKLLPRFLKKGTPRVKDLAQTILDNAAASTKRKQSNAKPIKEESPAKGDSPSAEIVGAKRLRDGESNGQPATKRMIVTSNLKDTLKPTSASNGPIKRTSEGIQNGKSAPVPAAPRPKPPIAAPKPTVIFGALSSASKRLGTTNAERKAAQAAAKPTPPPESKDKPTAPAPKPAFSFGDILADLSKPKQAAVAKPAEDKPPETEEERQKRLRKEARRKLRVTWKPDDQLTEVRLFTHDPDEELGPGDGSMRGMGDVKGEGSVLKLHKDLEELEEDDLGGIRETTLNDYNGLSEILIESADMKSANFVKRGGDEPPVSNEKTAQEQREATTLMVFHASPADVPPTPKEPPGADPNENASEVIPFGEIPDNVKARQERYFDYVNPKPAAATAAAAAVTVSAPVPAPAAAVGNPGFDISSLLQIIKAGTPQQQPAPPPVAQQAPMSDLERTISMFRQQQGQPQVPLVPQIPQLPIAQPPAVPGGVDFQQLMSVMQQFQQGTGFAQQQPVQSQPQMQPNLGAMFSQFAGQNQQAGPSNSTQSYEDPERKRVRDSGHYDDPYDNQWSRGKRTKANDLKPYKVGLVACRFWKEGKCRKGDNCTFRHDP